MEEQLTKKERRELRRQEKREEKSHRAKTRLIKRAALWIGAAVLIGGAIFAMIKLNGAGPVQNSLLTDAISPSDWVVGNKNSKTILIEYSDFQCPACGHYHPLVKQIVKEFGDKIEFAYRNFPLPMHQNADLAARVAEAAGAQSKFWEMHDMIFEHQEEWSEKSGDEARSILKQYAEKLGLDAARFESDLNSDKIKEKIENDRQSGIRSKVDSTPTFFLNGEKIQNPRSYDEFKSIISDAIAHKN